MTQIFTGTYTGLTLANILYDGANIWVTGNNSSTIGAVARINVAAVNSSTTNSMTCTSLGTTDCMYIQTGIGPFGMTFDGTNVWVANATSNNLTKIPPSGVPTTVTPSYSCQTPLALAFDSVNIWVTCQQSNYVDVLPVAGGTQYMVSGVTAPTYIAFDGTYMWVESSSGFFEVYAVIPPSFTLKASFTVPGGGGGVAFDGKYMWVIDYSTAHVYKYTSAGSQLGPYNAQSGSYPDSPAFDGGNMWVVNTSLNSLSKF